MVCNILCILKSSDLKTVVNILHADTIQIQPNMQEEG